MRKATLESAVTDRTFSISAGLLASTVTPGSTAPVASFTTPVNELCARAVAGNARHPSATTHPTAMRYLDMRILLSKEVPTAICSVEATPDSGGIDQEIGVFTKKILTGNA